MEKTLPDLLYELRTIQLKKLTRDIKTVILLHAVGGCTSSIIRGTLIVGGMVAAPFTLGASIGLSAAGTAIAVAGGTTTATAMQEQQIFSWVNLISKKQKKRKLNFLDITLQLRKHMKL